MKNFTKHYELPEYQVWQQMKARCFNKNHRHYHNYGGRGITVSERWMSFDYFYEDMGARPTSRHSLDRVDNDDGYSATNCRWATPKQQSRNTRKNKRIVLRDKPMLFIEALELHGLSQDYTTIRRRMKNGWSADKAFSTPIRRRIDKTQVMRIKKLLSKGDLMGVEIAKICGVSKVTVWDIARGRSWENV